MPRYFWAGTLFLLVILGGFSVSWAEIVRRPGKNTTGTFYLDESTEQKESIIPAKLKINPYLAVREAYNDNIFLDASNAQKDFITTVSPGLSISWPSNYLNLNLDYGFEFLIFQDHSEEDETSPGDAQRASMNAEILPKRDFSITVQEQISKVIIDERQPVAENNQFQNKTTQYLSTVNPRYRFRSIPTFEAILGYKFENTTYQSSQGDNSTSNTFNLDLRKDLSPRSKVFLNNAFQMFHASGSDDYNRQDFGGGFFWDVGPRLSIGGSAGVARLYFKDSENHTFPLWLAKVDYSASEKLFLGLQYSEMILNSVDEGLYRNKTVAGDIKYDRKISLRLDGFASDSTYTSANREDRSAGGGIHLGFPLGSFVKLKFQGQYTHFKFLPEKENVDRYLLGGNLGYLWKHLAVYLGYFYQDSNSNEDINDYRNNIIYLQIAMGFGKEKDMAVLSDPGFLNY